jgi:hypothetical protein
MILLDETSAIRAKVNAMTTIRNLSSRFNIYQSVNRNTNIMKLKYSQPSWCERFLDKAKVEVFKKEDIKSWISYATFEEIFMLGFNKGWDEHKEQKIGGSSEGVIFEVAINRAFNKWKQQ